MAKNRSSGGGSDPNAASLSRGGKPVGVSGRLANVFEQLWNRRKFDILGRKVKGDVRAKSVGKARSAAVEKRKATLLQEFQQRGKANLFLDRRFGEGDESIPEGEKAIVRFQKERMAQLSRKNRFALGDDDEDDDADDGGGEGGSEGGGFRLTHGGRDIDDFDDSDVSGFGDDDDDDDGALGDQIVRDYHFGGGFVPKSKSASEAEGNSGADEEEEGGEERQKTKKEVMAEVMAKSKMFKAKRQAEKEEDEQLREQLDEDFRVLAQSDALLSLTRPTKGKEKAGGGAVVVTLSAAAVPTGAVAAAAAGKAAAGGSLLAADVAEEEVDDKQYDVLAKEMIFDMRAKPGERSKTAEEAADAERARLVKLEAARKRRMEGEPSDDEEEEGEEGSSEEEGGKGRKRRQRKKAKREVSGDDLGENFVLEVEEEEEEKGWVHDVLARREDEEEDEEEEEEEGSGEGEESEEEDGGENLADVEWEQSDEEGGVKRGVKQGVFVAGRAGKAGESESEELEEGEEKEEGEESEDEEEEQVKQAKQQPQQKQQQEKVQENGASEEEEAEEEEDEAEEEEQERIERAFRRRELPYVIQAPQHLGELQQLLEGRAAAEVGVAIARIRACNAAHLSPDNKRKMQIFYNVLLQYFASLASDGGSNGQRLLEGQPGKKQKQQHHRTQQNEKQEGRPLGRKEKVKEGEQGEQQHQQQQEGEEEEVPTSELQQRAPSVAAAHINVLVQPLVELSASFPLFAAVCARERLARMQKRLVSRLKSGEPAWPTARTLLLLRLWALIFPSSDFRHPVMTPVALLLGQFLSCCPVRSIKDVAAGLFISALLLNMVSQSRRFVPEAVNFLHALLWSAVSPTLRPDRPKGVPRYMLLQVCSQQWLWTPCGDGNNSRKRKREPLEDKPQALDFDRIFLGPSSPSSSTAPSAADAAATASASTSTATNTSVSPAPAAPAAASKSPSKSPSAPPAAPSSPLMGVEGSAAGTVAEAYFSSDVFRLSLLLAALKTLRSFALLYRRMQPFPEIFSPFLPTLAALAESGQLPEEIEEERAAWVKDIEGAVAEVEGSRQLLRLRVKRAVPAKQFNPKFETDFARGKDYDPNRERAEQRKLQRAIKREARGAARELRKDNQFLAAARAQETAAAAEERKEKGQKALAFMEQQAALMWSGQLGRKRGGGGGRGRR